MVKRKYTIVYAYTKTTVFLHGSESLVGSTDHQCHHHLAYVSADNPVQACAAVASDAIPGYGCKILCVFEGDMRPIVSNVLEHNIEAVS